MTLGEFLQTYGYFALFAGTVLEGETILVMAGFAAHRGYLRLELVMAVAFLGSLTGDQLAFWVGRRYGRRVIDRFPKLRPGVARATNLLERRGTPLFLGFRFVYGVRNLVPLAAGMSAIPASRFVALNALGAAAWATVVASAGYAFGHGFELVMARAREFEGHALLLLLAVGTLVALVRHVVKRARTKSGR
jgi:membrane protein DedA with SNARE-associated domain